MGHTISALLPRKKVSLTAVVINSWFEKKYGSRYHPCDKASVAIINKADLSVYQFGYQYR